MKIDSIEIIIQDSETGYIYDVTNIAGKVSIERAMEKSSGKCSFNIDTNINKLNFSKGSTVSIKVNGKGMFFGYIFKTEFSDADSCSITAYDQTRYLKNKYSYVFSGMTSGDIIQRIARDFGLRIGYIRPTGYIVPEKVNDNKALGDIIQDALDQTLIGTGNYYIIRDEFGYLCQRSLTELRTNLVIGDYSLLESYKYSEDIDGDTYNQIRLFKDNKDTGKREVYIAKDSNMINRWGLLQMYESVDENMNDAQAIEKAHLILNLKNRVLKSISLKALGDLRVDAGTGVYLQLTDIPQVTFNQEVVITKVTHTFDAMIHTMDLEVMFE